MDLNIILAFIAKHTPQKFIEFTGDIYLSKKPMFIQYKPEHHKVKGLNFEYVRSVVEPGDILLRRYNGYLNTIGTPGFYGHAGAYVGRYDFNLDGRQVIEVPSVIHALGEGVIKETLADFCRTDHLCVIRPNWESVEDKTYFINKLHEMLGAEYDYDFETGNTSYYCTEMVNIGLKNKLDHLYKVQYGKSVLLPDPIREYFSDRIIYEH